MVFLLGLLFNLALGSPPTATLDIISSRRIETDIIRNTVKLEDLRIQDKGLSPSEVSKIRARHSGGGGDDVGNGGDELRQEFLRIGEELINETGLYELTPALDVKRIVVLNDLKVIKSGEEISPKSIAVEGIIFLDAKSWDPNDGLLSTNYDPRYQMIGLLVEALELNMSDVKKLTAWRTLGYRQGAIWCPSEISQSKIQTTFREFKGEGQSSQEAESNAMAKCEYEGQHGCRIRESIVSGFMGWTKNHAIAVGQKFKLARKTPQEARQDHCKAIRACEQIHEWAPRGQVGPAHFELLAKEASRVCR